MIYVATIYRGVALNQEIRILGINSTDIVREVEQAHHTSPCATIALGRTISITSLMGFMMEYDDDKISVMIKGDGPLGAIHAQYLGNKKVRGYVDNPNVDVLFTENNKLDIKGVVGTIGQLLVVKKGVRLDYNGSTPLVSGEISEDFTYYFASSEQTPSVVSSGVSFDQDGSIACAGAIIIQLLPGATEASIKYIENCLDKIGNITQLLLEKDINELIIELFPDFDLLDENEIAFECDCSCEAMRSKIATLSVNDLEEIKNEDHGIEAVCPWCNKKYWFDEEALTELIEQKK